MRHAAHARAAATAYFENQVAIGNIKVEHRDRSMRYRIREQPLVPFGSPDELARLRAQHFLRDHRGKWMTRARFDRMLDEVYDNFVNAYKS